ncbi:MAG TPA: DUF1572 domain-containing protein [Ferruginibacter sp.]|nr:DUF1572 domain-containing protein [Ferruginibacter sp.]HMP21068.1 DUF1572 domain-containing protein [Ferruginibacter sp.]
MNTTTTKQIAQHFRQVHTGGNWTSVNLQDTLAGVDWKMATTTVQHCNSIAALVFHINYYVSEVLKVLQGHPLQAHDTYSFLLPPLRGPEDWEKLLQKTFADAEAFARLVENMPDEKLQENFEQEKYGSYFRNLQGIIEHTHYHLGQIVIIKKMIGATTP